MAAPARKKAAPRRARVCSKAALKEFLAGVVQLAEPVLDRLGFELVRAACPIEGGQPVLRLFIDRAEGEEAITLDDCAAFSRALDEAIEAAGFDSPEIEDYLMEVSSPGLDRPLVKPADYQRFQGRLVKIKLRRGDRNVSLTGRLGRGESGGLIIEAGGETAEFEFGEVVSCRLSLDDLKPRTEG